ncbi:MAG: hypothetical protein HOV79_20415, partial [Hamadaea sp.]|nr:hypothetical protein [Hamadaea sp.]
MGPTVGRRRIILGTAALAVGAALTPSAAVAAGRHGAPGTPTLGEPQPL